MFSAQNASRPTVRPNRVMHFAPSHPTQKHLRSLLADLDDAAIATLEDELQVFGGAGVLSSNLETLIDRMDAPH